MSIETFLSRVSIAAALVLAASTAKAQQGAITCQALSAPLTVRAEGKTEQVGNITLNCGGGTPGARLTTNLTVFLDRNITNRTSSNDTFRDIVLSVDQGSGLNATGMQAMVNGVSSAAFNGVSFTVPPSGRILLMVSGIRANVSTSPGPVTAFLNINGAAGLTLNTNALTVAQPLTALFTTGTSTPIECGFSVLPSLSFDEAIQERTFSFTARLTEGFTTAFTPREPGADTGVRFIARYSGFPSTAKLFVPDVIAGSSSNVPTSAGDLGRAASAGQYTPGSLLLVRILGTDANGAGGFPLAAAGQSLPFGSLREVSLSNGGGIAVYEVVDSNPALRESAQVPTFLDMRAVPQNTSTVARLNVTFGPVDETSVLRFANLTPNTDCSVLGDCGAGYFPQLNVDTTPVTATAILGSGYQVRYITIRNDGTGFLVWNARVNYTSGADWIRLERTSGTNNSTLRADILPDKVPGPGTYQANIIVDAGAVGSRTVPVTFTVQPVVVPTGPAVNSVTSAGVSTDDAIVPGGQAVLKGVRLGGRDVQVRVGGASARLVYTSADEIHFEVPQSLSGISAELVVTVDGTASTARTVKLKALMPAVFADGVVNEDWTGNSASQPARAGTVVKIFLTGIPQARLETVTVRMHDWDGLRPVTAAAMTEHFGISYVDVQVPVGIPAITSDLVVCAQGTEGSVCSAPVRITLAQ